MNTLRMIFEPPFFYFMLMGFGVVILLMISNRRFKRRGLGGLQHFKNYYVGFLTLFVEAVFSLLGYALILWCILSLLIG